MGSQRVRYNQATNTQQPQESDITKRLTHSRLRKLESYAACPFVFARLMYVMLSRFVCVAACARASSAFLFRAE